MINLIIEPRCSPKNRGCMKVWIKIYPPLQGAVPQVKTRDAQNGDACHMRVYHWDTTPFWAVSSYLNASIIKVHSGMMPSRRPIPTAIFILDCAWCQLPSHAGAGILPVQLYLIGLQWGFRPWETGERWSHIGSSHGSLVGHHDRARFGNINDRQSFNKGIWNQTRQRTQEIGTDCQPN